MVKTFTSKILHNHILVISLLTAIVLIGMVFLFLSQKALALDSDVYSQIMVEVGSKPVSASAFLQDPLDTDTLVCHTDMNKIPYDIPGVYAVEFTWHGRFYERTLQVADTRYPIVRVKSLEVMERIPEPQEFITYLKDATEVTVSYESQPDINNPDPQEIILCVEDGAGNQTKLKTKLVVLQDEQAPIITGIRPLIVYEGDTVSYKKDIKVTDNFDKLPKLSVDAAQVDLSKAGIYPVIYQAADSSGNTAKIETTIEVRAFSNGFATAQEVYAEIDQVIAEIITDDMTNFEKAEAVYYWSRSFPYSYYADKEEVLQAAHYMLKHKTGDCYTHFAACKLIFDRLGFPNIDVKKVKNSPHDWNHYWSLVSIDGGKSYYHFDGLDRIDGTEYLCLLTDDELDAYSAKRKNSHNRDRSLYPNTPKESLYDVLPEG